MWSQEYEARQIRADLAWSTRAEQDGQVGKAEQGIQEEVVQIQLEVAQIRGEPQGKTDENLIKGVVCSCKC